MTDILLICGTRPEVIKLGPVYAALKQRGVATHTILTGQHTDLLRDTPAEGDLKFSTDLEQPSDGNVPRWITVVQNKLQRWFERYDPKIVVVQGDTMSAYTGATVANLMEVPLAHVEAGVRSHDRNDPWPEEETRVAIAQLARWHYAPTSTAFSNLVSEGVPHEHIRVTGNTVVSALARYTPYVKPVSEPADRVLVTLHRREIQKQRAANELYGAIRLQALQYPQLEFVWPMHPAMKQLVKRIEEPANLKLVESVGYQQFVELLASSFGVLTDSGGLVEEAATLGVPCIVLRLRNDRPEAEEAGVALRCDPCVQGVRQGMDALVSGRVKREPTTVFGDASASEQIAEHLASSVRAAS